MSQNEMFDKPKPMERAELLERATTIYREINDKKSELEDLKLDFTFEKEHNKLGLPKAIVKSTMKIAEVDAGNTFEKLVEKRLAQEEFEEDYKELTGYDA